MRLLDKDKVDDRGRRKISLTQLQPGEQGAPRGQRVTSGPAGARKNVSPGFQGSFLSPQRGIPGASGASTSPPGLLELARTQVPDFGPGCGVCFRALKASEGPPRGQPIPSRPAAARKTVHAGPMRLMPGGGILSSVHACELLGQGPRTDG